MKCSVFFVLSLFLILLLPSPILSLSTPKLSSPHSRYRYFNSSPPYRYDIKYYNQTLDHFSFTPTSYFSQRYLVGSSDNWSTNDPIFFYCGNEGDIEWFAANTGFVWEVAPKFSALVIFMEHRYYGESMPYGSKEKAYKDADSLAYLTTEQALADFATFITDFKEQLSSKDSPVVLFGGSYGGMLAAWMRLKYPHIAIGAFASSAPILQFEDIVPPETFYDIVSNDFKRESLSCFNSIKKSWAELDVLGQTHDGLTGLSKKFHLCHELNYTQQLSNWLESAYSYLAMVDYPYPSEFMMPLPANPIKEVCKNIDHHRDGADLLDHIFAGVSIYYNYTGNVSCFDLNDDPHGMSGWDWQACTEMVMPMSSSKENSMFPPYDFDSTAYNFQCAISYGVIPRPNWVTTEFGGHDIKKTLQKFGSNIIFSNGLLDPWSGGGVLHNISNSITALVTELGANPTLSAHHIDLRASTADDPKWLIDLRESEIEIIKSWISDYYQHDKFTYSM